MSGQDVVCTHERAEQETMLADGYCVECLLATLAEKDELVERLRREAEQHVMEAADGQAE